MRLVFLDDGAVSRGGQRRHPTFCQRGVDIGIVLPLLQPLMPLGTAGTPGARGEGGRRVETYTPSGELAYFLTTERQLLSSKGSHAQTRRGGLFFCPKPDRGGHPPNFDRGGFPYFHNSQYAKLTGF